MYVAPYVLQRDARYFSPHPNDFWPERWLLASRSPVQLPLSTFLGTTTRPAPADPSSSSSNMIPIARSVDDTKNTKHDSAAAAFHSPSTIVHNFPMLIAPATPSPTPAVVTAHDTRAFFPFSLGPANCAGRALARAEMRMVLALLMKKFEFSFTAEYDAGKWERELRDWMVVKTGGLPVLVRLREGVNGYTGRKL